jgi:deoxyribonuclease IV
MTRRTPKKRRLCLGSHLSVAGGVSNAVTGAIQLDLESLQIFTKNASRWEQKPTDPEEVDRFLARREEWGKEKPVLSHDSYLINLASGDRVLREKSIAALRDELERARILELDGVVMHPGAHVGDGVEKGLQRVAEALRCILDETPEGSTRFLLENTAGGGTTLGRSFEELAIVLEGVDAPERMGVCLDTCHMFAAGYDIRKPAGCKAMTEEIDSVIGAEQVRCWHFNDSKGTCGSHLDRHQHIGQGELGVSPFRQILKDERFFGVPKILETPKKDDMDPVNLALLAKL